MCILGYLCVTPNRVYFLCLGAGMAPGQFYGGDGMNTCEGHVEIREQLRDHEKRIVALEKADAEFAIKLQNLIEKIDSLTGWIKALVVSIITAGVGFIIWYIQSLPR
jgi:hypothetical protein